MTAQYTRASKYYNGSVGEYKDNEVVYPRVIDFASITPETTYIITAGMANRPDLISNVIYGRDDLGWYVMEANQIDHVKDLTVGKGLKVYPVLGVIL